MEISCKFGKLTATATVDFVDEIATIADLKKVIRRLFSLNHQAPLNIYFPESTHCWKLLYSALQFQKLLQTDRLSLVATLSQEDESADAEFDRVESVMEPNAMLEFLNDVSLLIGLDLDSSPPAKQWVSGERQLISNTLIIVAPMTKLNISETRYKLPLNLKSLSGTTYNID